jgi:hypothetical protein
MLSMGPLSSPKHTYRPRLLKALNEEAKTKRAASAAAPASAKPAAAPNAAKSLDSELLDLDALDSDLLAHVRLKRGRWATSLQHALLARTRPHAEITCGIP